LSGSRRGGLVAALVSALWPWSGHAATATATATAVGTAAIGAVSGPAAAAPVNCHLPGLPLLARCATLQRPLDPAQPQGVQITLHYAVLPALARHKAPDPVVLLAGGPGQSAIDLAGPMAARLARLNQWRDLVFVDQRGTGRSAPLRCADDLPDAALMPLAQALDPQRRVQRLADCRRALQRLPYGDLRLFSTTLAMQDLDAVRQALGAPQLNLVGASYGTRAALEYLRLYPQHVRRAVLDGVAPADMRLPQAAALDYAAAGQAQLQACRDEPACDQRYPKLAQRWQQVLAGLPRRVTLTHPVSGQTEQVKLDPDTARSALRAPLYAPWLAAGLPAVVDAAARGQFDPLMALASVTAGVPGGLGGIATGMHFSVVCSEDLGAGGPPAAQAEPGRAEDNTESALGAGPGRLYQAACRNWPRATVPAGFYRLNPSPAPVWVLSGGRDPVTPPRHGARVAQALGAMARHTVVPQAGHGLLGLACVRQAVQLFITTTEPVQALAAQHEALQACASALPAPLAYQPPGLIRPSLANGAPR
jgi:pimeloyl-ACP methyl ester carboxylesterase